MKLSIKSFMLMVVFLIITTTFLIFLDYYRQQQQQTADVIFNGMQNDMSELSYVLSKQVSYQAPILASRALIDRAAANNDFIAAIQVLDQQEVMMTTDPSYREAPAKSDVAIGLQDESLQVFKDKVGLEGQIRFYDGEKLKTLELVFLFDKAEIANYLNHNQTKFLVYFALLPGLVVMLVALLFHVYITRPLEKLRQYAYYQSQVPKVMRIRELESIRSSMLQTFTRLDQEQEELYRIARTDSLSGLANRNALNEYLRRLISDCERNQKEFVLLFLDLDNFKAVNDALGHHVGDELLQKVAATISEVLRGSDYVARVGGDEFVVVLHEYQDVADVIHVIERIQARLAQPWLIQSHPIHISSSVGIAFYPKDGMDIISLMQHSDIAMYEAKKKGRAQYHFFTQALNEEVQRTIALDKAMRDALRNNEYELYYQPKVDAQTGAIVGAEALIRWNSPQNGLVSPNEFIPLAEHNGFIVELGEWVLKTAFKQQIAWRNKGLDLSVSINLAAQQLVHDHFETQFEDLAHNIGIDPQKIELEITEYFFLEQNKQNLDVLNRLHQKGYRIALDDFGTGYSSLAYLKRFPVDTLKIDKAFVDDFDSEDGAVFLDTMIKMGQSLKMQVIAEGVETEAQREYLLEAGCSYFQGYLCSKPLPVDEFEAFFHQRMG